MATTLFRLCPRELARMSDDEIDALAEQIADDRAEAQLDADEDRYADHLYDPPGL